MTQKEWARILQEYHSACIAAEKKDSLNSLIKEEMIKKSLAEKEAGGFIAKISTFEKESFQTAKFKKENPDIYNAYTEKKSITTLRIK